MIRFLADECLNDNIVRGLLRTKGMDVVRALEVGLAKASDPALLAWAAEKQRVLLTHDSRTMPSHAYDRVVKGQPMPGVLVVPANLGINAAIDELILIHQLAVPEDFDRQVRYLPFS